MLNVLKVGAVYFAVVFLAGFVLGSVRVLWVVPLVRTRAAELLEAPFMLLIAAVAALWLVHRFRYVSRSSHWLGVGPVALALMIVVEFTVVRLRGLSLPEYFANRDPVSSAVYFASLAAFAIFPLLLSRIAPRDAA